MSTPYITPLPPVYDPRYDFTTIVAPIDVTTGVDSLVRPGERSWMVDALDQRFVDLLESIKFWTFVLWKGQKITSLCYQVHGVQNTWMIVLAFNGLTSPMQLRHGMVLRFPTKQSIDDFLASLQPKLGSGSGKRVTI